MSKITYTDKVDNTVSALPAINKVAAADLNEIKESVNYLYDNVPGWARYDDTQYTTLSPYNFSAETEFTIPNNAGNVINTHIHSTVPFYDGANSKVYAENENDVYIITVAFKAKLSNANGFVEMSMEGGNGTPYDRIKNTIVFPKGNDVEHSYAINFQYYADADVVANGLTLKLLPSHAGSIYEVIYFVQCTQKHTL
jgi:hypothetical protein